MDPNRESERKIRSDCVNSRGAWGRGARVSVHTGGWRELRRRDRREEARPGWSVSGGAEREMVRSETARKSRTSAAAGRATRRGHRWWAWGWGWPRRRGWPISGGRRPQGRWRRGATGWSRRGGRQDGGDIDQAREDLWHWKFRTRDILSQALSILHLARFGDLSLNF